MAKPRTATTAEPNATLSQKDVLVMSEPFRCLEIRGKQNDKDQSQKATQLDIISKTASLTSLPATLNSHNVIKQISPLTDLDIFQVFNDVWFDLRVCCCPSEPGGDVLAGGIKEQAGEGQRWRQAVFITELCRSHSMKLLDLRKVHLGGDQHTRDVALHVMLLSKNWDKERKLQLSEKKTYLVFIIGS